MPRPELSTLRYPNLWQGCVGAWCPSQSGATGYRLFDDSGNNNHGTLTNMDPGTDWVPSGGKLALDFDGSNDQVNLTNDIALSSRSFSMSFWAAQVGGAAANMPFGNRNTTNSYIWFRSANYLRVAFPIGTIEFTAITAFTELSHYVVTGSVSSAGLSSIGLSVNGKAQTPLIIADSTFTLNTIGAGYSGAFWFPGQIDDVRAYNRALTPQEIRLLYTGGRGAAYERSRGRKKAYVPGYRITAPSRIQTGSARTIDGTDTESLSRGLVGAWCPSLGASGYRLLDRSGNNNHGTLTNMDPGTDWVPSGGKLALDFDGVNDYVDTGSNIGCNGANYRTISHWFKRSTNSTSHFLGCWGGSNAGGDRFGFYLLAQTLYVVAEGSGGGNTGYASWNANSNFYEWTHLLLQFDGSQPSLLTRLALAVNGSFVPLLNPIGTVPTSLGTGLGNFFIGYNQNVAQPYTTGQVDDVRLYRRPLTAQEVRLLYTGGRGVGLLPEAKPKRARIVAWDNRDKISVPARVLTNTDSLKRGLVGHWSPSLSGPQGNRLMDLSGQNNHGTLQNMDYQTDYVPSTDKGGRMALDFDGTDDRVVVPNSSNLQITGPITLSFWLNIVNNGQVSTIISKSTGADGEYEVFADFRSGNTWIQWRPHIGSTAIANFFLGYTNIWTHVAVTCDNSSSGANVQYYRNGIFIGNATTNTARVASNYDVNIGTRPNGGNPANTKLDDVRIYNRVLTPQEIRLLAQSRMPERATPQRTRTVFYSSGLVSYLRRRTYNSILGSGVLS